MQPADSIFVNGRVYVQKGRFETALAVSRRARARRGTTTRLARLRRPEDTRVVDLRGRLVTPGFNDAHVHFIDGGFGLLSVDLRDAKDEADFARRIGRHAADSAEGDLDPERQLGPRALEEPGACPRGAASTPSRPTIRSS